MPCYSPIRAYRAASVNDSGKRGLVFNRQAGLVDQPVDIACGRCLGCKLEYARRWAIRCMHEASLHEENSFITLTYEDKYLPFGGTLVKSHWQDFMKRLRWRLGDERVRFYMCGEYGDSFDRPHYHACLFGWTPPDKRFYKKGKVGDAVYKSKFLDDVWKFGFTTVGTVTFESAGYCARYLTKKITRPDKCKKCSAIKEECEDCFKARTHYERLNYETGEVYSIEPEFCLMSRRPGIGTGWLELYKDEVSAHDSVIVNGKEVQPPEFYIDKLPEEEREKVKAKRLKAQKNTDGAERSLSRLRVKEEVKTAAVNVYKRGQND